MVLCPKCAKPAEKISGQLKCLSCNLRLCPKAHIVTEESNICKVCGYLYGHATPRSAKPQTSETPHLARSVEPSQFQHSAEVHQFENQIEKEEVPYESISGSSIQEYHNASGESSRGDFISPQEKIRFEKPRSRRPNWNIPPIKRFLRPVLAGLVLVGIMAGAVFGIGTLVSYLLNSGEDSSLSPLPPDSPSTTFILTAESDDANRGIVLREPNETNYTEGTPVTLIAKPSDDYYFDRWSGDIDTTDTSGITIVIMNSNKQITAHFKVIDTTPPEISEIHVLKYSDTTATIAWKASENATGLVKYKRRDTGDYTNSVPSAPDAMDNHVVKLTGLRPNGIYYYIVELADESGNKTTSNRQALSTLHPIKEGHEEGKRAPNLTLQPYENWPDNDSLELATFLGKKKVFINFWSTFCAPCIVEFPVLEAIYADIIDREEWEIITICIDGRGDRIVKLKEKYPVKLKHITLPILFYAEGADRDAYHIWKVPTNVFIDEDGIIRHVKLGRFIDTPELKKVLDSI